ncbi:class II fructose-bisphosphate aldolase [Mycolicibacterium palauense]|uniref:class II fructose-bisphosphate aldolase n=1 Tax=Mycolicibacterium palauense TaxID=2034511 RepID=UPI000BFEC34D|nr:class II fructose-bisphosphate aldolase [Mycolicibacterium palauense]
MPVVALDQILKPAYAKRYGVAAINVFNDLTMETALATAVTERSPLIVQTSVKTVRTIGARTLYAMWTAMTAGIEVPVSLHLDHCPDRAVISECLSLGWNSVLFDASEMPVAENQRQTIDVVAEARRYGAHVEGEIESITGVEDGHGSDDEAQRQPLETVLEFITQTGVDVFAPAIGNAHGVYKQAPVLDFQRVEDIAETTSVPVALHGGSGLSDADFRRLIALGCAKVNISTALKMTYMKANLGYLNQCAATDRWDPPSLFRHTAGEIQMMVAALMRQFGSSGAAA